MKLRTFLYPLPLLAAAVAAWWFFWGRDTADLPAAQPAADSYAYSVAFEAELKGLGQLTADEFSERYGGKAAYLPKLSWDPTTATFWDRFSLDPADPDRKVQLRGEEERWVREDARRKGRPLPDGKPVMV